MNMPPEFDINHESWVVGYNMGMDVGYISGFRAAEPYHRTKGDEKHGSFIGLLLIAVAFVAFYYAGLSDGKKACRESVAS